MRGSTNEVQYRLPIYIHDVHLYPLAESGIFCSHRYNKSVWDNTLLHFYVYHLFLLAQSGDICKQALAYDDYTANESRAYYLSRANDTNSGADVHRRFRR